MCECAEGLCGCEEGRGEGVSVEGGVEIEGAARDDGEDGAEAHLQRADGGVGGGDGRRGLWGRSAAPFAWGGW